MTIATTVSLLLLTVAPVYATPSLSLGSSASYSLTGKLLTYQSCTADPVAYASQACGNYIPVPVAANIVNIFDDSKCLTSSPPNDPFAALLCRFDPANLTVTQGSTVFWYNRGNLTHTVTANQTANMGLPSFDSGNITRGGVYSRTFGQIGTYYYYDKFLGPLLRTMRGIITVTTPPPPPPPPKPTSVEVDLTGSIGWKVEGLSMSQANLLVSHTVALTLSPLPLVSFTPVTETGSFEQSINLSTRVESPGTATSIVRSLLGSVLRSLPVTNAGTGVSGLGLQSMLAGRSSDPDYTEWWVNGPLSNGSPVQILNGWSSVTGSESLDFGGSIGTRQAWIVTSQLSQTFDVNVPSASDPFAYSSTSMAAASLNLLWSYDRTADLLLRTNDTLTLTSHSVTPSTLYTPLIVCVPAQNVTACATQTTGGPSIGVYPPPIICLPSGCPPPITVKVIRDTAVTVNLALRLATTSIDLSAAGASRPTSTIMDLFASLPWMPFGIAGVAAGAGAALILWFTRRAKGTPLPAPNPIASPPSSPSTTS